MLERVVRFFTSPRYELKDVFGVQREAPKATYVDRGGLDAQFERALQLDRHIVIYGASKQGKSSLRRKLLKDKNTIEIQCIPTMNAFDIVKEIAHRAGYRTHTSSTVSVDIGSTVSSGKPSIAAARQMSDTFGPPERPSTIDWDKVSSLLHSKGTRVVIEDFHYLDEEQRKEFAFLLKALWEAGIFVIIVGVWAEQNLLIYYNGDLAQRIEEIDLVWSDRDLRLVIERGEKALNICLDDRIKDALIEDSFGNVGLLQTLAERLCLNAGIVRSQRRLQRISDFKFLEKAREQTASELRQRYNSFSEAFSKGLRHGRQSLYKYKTLLRVLVEATDSELITGIGQDELLTRIHRYDERIRSSDLSSALNHIGKLQASTGIRPLVFSYNQNTRKISLVDRQLLFFRKYGSPKWPWESWQDSEDVSEV